jgi:hypothetical protein
VCVCVLCVCHVDFFLKYIQNECFHALVVKPPREA